MKSRYKPIMLLLILFAIMWSGVSVNATQIQRRPAPQINTTPDQIQTDTDESTDKRPLIIIAIAGLSLIGIGVSTFIKDKNMIISPSLKGQLTYGDNEHDLIATLDLKGRTPIKVRIGPNADEVKNPNIKHYIHTKRGSNFDFTITPIQSADNLTIIHIKCEPPGTLRHRDDFKAETNLYGNERFIINGMYFRYVTDSINEKGRNVLGD